jgi:hypothetical protein
MKCKTLAQRRAARQRYRDNAIARASVMGMSARCAYLASDPDNPDHGLCMGEDKRVGAGCLCRCHDKDFT